MEIWRIKNHPEESVIIHKELTIFIKELPTGLKRILTDKLRELTEVKKIIPIFTDRKKVASILFELPAKIVMLGETNGLNEQSKKDIAETMELLLWHLSPRWSFSNPGAFGSPRHCTTCGLLANPAAIECQNPSCPSHDNYRKITGTSNLTQAEKDAANFKEKITCFFKGAKKIKGLQKTT